MAHPLGRFPLLALISMALATACSGPSVSAGSSPTSTAVGTHPRSGALRGHLYGVGGPAPGRRRPFPGTITVSGSGSGTRREAKADSDGAYSMTIPPGRYTVTGHSPGYNGGAVPCPAQNPAQVSNGGTTTLDVYCQMM